MSKSDSGESNGSTESSNSTSNESGNGANSNTKGTTPPRNSLDVASTQTSNPSPNKSPVRRRLAQATELRFQCIEGRTSVARVAVLLCNISDRPLYYKFKTDTMDLLSALPSATGHIAARGSSKVVLTWQRPKIVKTWQEVTSPKLLLVTRFLDVGGLTNDTTSTRLIAFLDSSTSCPSDNPPLEQLMLDALSKNVNEAEMTITKSENDSPSFQLGPHSTADGTNPNVTLALALLVIFIGICLYRALFPVAVVVRSQ